MTRRSLLASFPALLGLPQIAPAAPPPYFVFTSFRGNGEDGLHLALSRDGYRWTALAADRSFLKPTVGKEKLVRDPSVARGPDGLFHMVWTCGWWERGIGYASSKDLINWSAQRVLPVMESEPTARNAWAPEVLWDSRTRRFIVHWSTTIPGRFPETDGSSEDGLDHRVYYTTTRDFRTLAPPRLLLDPGFNCIDATLVETKGKWVAVFKDERLKPAPRKELRIARADRPGGPYTAVGAAFSRQWVEGPAVLRVGEDYVVYFDEYTRKRYGALRTRDFEAWEDVSDRLSLPPGTRHGSAFAVPAEVGAALERLG
jgi:hypothetical protein